MIADYIDKINEYLRPDDEYGSLHLDNYEDVDLEYNLKKSAEYLQTLKNNSHKIEQIIAQNDKFKHQNAVQLRAIEMHLKKEIQLKLCISNMQEQIHILNQQLICLQSKFSEKQAQYSSGISPKQYAKLLQKLQNCIAQNEILRQQNKRYYDQEFIKQKNYHQLELKFKESIRVLHSQNKSLQTNLQYQTEKACLLEKIEAENNLFKLENKRLHSLMDMKLDEYESKTNSLIKQLEIHRVGKQVFKEKYQQLTQVIQIVDGMRHEFKSKKQSLQFAEEQKKLLNDSQFDSTYSFSTNQKKTIPKILKHKNKNPKQNKEKSERQNNIY